MKRIIAVSMVKNESDIIESFCRHTLTFCDAMVVCDDESVDNTKEIIEKMITEGLNIVLLNNSNTFGFYQSAIVNDLARIAIDTYGADLILPLDADEFLYSVADTPLRWILEGLADSTAYTVHLYYFLPSTEKRENNVFLPSYFNSFYNRSIPKVVASAKILKEFSYSIAQGNHFVYPACLSSPDIGRQVLENAMLVHIPIRSVEQAMAKTVVGWANALCMNDKEFNDVIKPFHWEVMYNLVKENGSLHPSHLNEYINYFIKLEGIEDANIPIAECHIPNSIELRYTNYEKSQKNCWNIILSHYEHIIESFKRQIEQLQKN